MGQGYKIVNVTKRQFINPHDFDEGYKMLEFVCHDGGAGFTMAALGALLTSSCGLGGGDLRFQGEQPAIIGSWAGDRVVIAGDYDAGGRFFEHLPEVPAADVLKEIASETNTTGDPGSVNLYNLCNYAEKTGFTNVSDEIIAALNTEREMRVPMTAILTSSSPLRRAANERLAQKVP